MLHMCGARIPSLFPVGHLSLEGVGILCKMQKYPYHCTSKRVFGQLHSSYRIADKAKMRRVSKTRHHKAQDEPLKKQYGKWQP